MKGDYIEAGDGHRTDSGETKTLDCKEGYAIFTIKCAPGDNPSLDPPEHKLMSVCQKLRPPKKHPEKKPHMG